MADGYNEPDFGEYGSTTDANDKKDRWGVSILDDLLRWMPDWTFRVDAFPSECLTLSGALSLAVGITFLLAAFLNVVIPHYEKIVYSVQTRCQITAIKKDDLVDDALYHYDVKFPLPGIPGLREGEVMCWGSQACSIYTEGSRHDCFFNTEDHSLRFYTNMSGHHTLRLFSYIILMFPFLIGACCCLIPASSQWNRQINQLTRDVKGYWDETFKGGQHGYEQVQDRRSYQGEMNQAGAYGGSARYPEYVQHGGAAGSGDSGGVGVGGGMSNVSWMRMQMGV